MKYFGTVSIAGREFNIQGRRGYSDLVTISAEFGGMDATFRMEAKEARELARHLVAAAETAEFETAANA